jgi:hypothetical protein
MISHQEEGAVWAERNFGKAKLRDERRVERVIKIAEAMAANPGGSIPQLFSRSYDVKAAYNLFKNNKATPDNLQLGHREIVKEEMETRGVYLLLEDTTEMIWPQPRAGLGPVGDGKGTQQGFHLHSVLTVKWQPIAEGQNKRPSVEVVGFCDQQYHIRKPLEDKRGNARKGKTGDLESEFWDKASQRIGAVKDINGAIWIRVCDRGADIYEFLSGCQKLHHDFVVRARHNRVLVDSETKKPTGNLVDNIGSQPALGEFSLELRGRGKEPARTAKLSISAMPVSLRAPQRPGADAGKNPPINCWAVRVWEASPPKDVEPLEWLLLCSTKVATFEQALECALQYSARWIIEEFHKALKLGLGAERLQLETADALFAAIAIMSIVALRLIDLREQLRFQPTAPAQQSCLNEMELQVLGLKINKPIETVKDVALALGRLGGHLNRKSDGMPGWQSLWRGMLKLQSLVEGFRLAHNL